MLGVLVLMSVVHAEPLTLQLDASRQFDFWLGEWDCSWNDGDRRQVATDAVSPSGNKLLGENVDGRPSLDFPGLRNTVYDRSSGAGTRRDFGVGRAAARLRGSFENGGMELRRDGEVDGAPAIFRMRWENIERDSFDWSWQRSDDDGETWTSLWEIEYSRVL